MNRSTGPSLVLSILGDHAGDIAERTSVRAEAHDLSIGRAEHCDWVLQAQGVSRQHAFVRHLNGLYFIEDRSTNGMLLNGAPLRGGEPVSLGDGDRLQLDTFEILVALESTVDEQATARREHDRSLQTLRVPHTSPAYHDSPLPLGTAPSLITGDAHGGSSLIPGTAAAPLDPMAWFQTVMPVVDHASAAVEASGHWNHASPMTDRFDAPTVDSDPPRVAPVLPEHWDRTRSLFQMPPDVATADATPEAPMAAAPAEPASPPVGARPARDPNTDPVPSVPAPTPTPPSPTTGIEPLFALVLDGVMDVLRARAELKNGFRLPATLIQRRENNPLKFAPTGTEALARVLAAPNEAFLSGEAAIVDAMDDIREHQVALLAGVRAAFDDLIAQFDPARFEEGDTRRSRFGFAPASGPWERYRAHFQKLATDPEERFRRLFGDEFARAYEDQLVRAKRDNR
ncbi:MAG: type VI secretion system-associated FHA domain protein TagH [Luteibacter sp.]|uniref:type VI secretion system-associated FHA domain protein TagH n=1 Tax=Luteibacter sp. TaxID=1886636 RepID=UPI002809D0F0|nr:type VI secretion system-associated FHA domain protein TagH [Luteibacter sp.]MDQ7997113.1 type VI secretion system-associated FHA domain protein TagH [Luteibacter sp.]MDQ8049763.1 type VI secretion system-associated FHA domain protein TagH [Luteibacter sp.]